MATNTVQSSFYSKASTPFGTTSPVTGSAPTDVADGLAIADCSQVTIIISAPSGQTLSGAGTIQIWEWYPQPLLDTSRWVRVPGLDFSITTSGVRDLEVGVVQVAAFKTGVPQNLSTRLMAVPSGVTFTGGSGIIVTLVGTKRNIASNGNL